MSLFSEFKKNILRNKLIQEDERILLGLSGGLDSVVLLHLLIKLQKQFPFCLRVVHVNYHLRGKESQRDEKYVRALAKKWDFSLEVLSVRLTSKSSLQDQARKIRYQFFGKIAKKHKCKKVFVAHHAQDQVETFFIKLLQGAGLQGLSSMTFEKDSPFVSDLKTIRPLLAFTKKDLLSYAKEESLKWCEDSSNLKSDYLRNFIRLKLLKSLEKIHPQVYRKISEALETLQNESLWLEKYVANLLKKEMKKKSSQIKLSVKFVREQGVAIRLRIYLSILKELGILPSREHLLELDAMVMDCKTHMKLSLAKGFGASLEKGHLLLKPWRSQNLHKRGFF